MDLLKSHKRRSRFSEALYITLSLGLAVVLFVIAQIVALPWLAVLVVVLSKWRIFAVRPRFWWANLLANTVDIIVGIGAVILIYSVSGAIWTQAVLAGLYALWLIFIKPRSRKSFVAAQALIAAFIGVTALSIISFNWDSIFFVVAIWWVGYASVRHVLGSYEEPLTEIYAVISALLFVEFGWIAYHWLFAYTIPGTGGLMLSQLALFTTLCLFVSERAYASYHRNGYVRAQDVLLPALLTASVVLTLIVLFNGLADGGIS